MRWSLALLLAFALMVPLTSAATIESLQAAAVEWQAPGQGEGALVALAAVGDNGEPFLNLTSSSLDLSWDETTTYIQAPGEPFLALFPKPGSAHYDQAALQVRGARADWFVYVFPAGAVTARSDCGTAGPATTTERVAPIMVDGTRTAPRADTSTAIRVEGTPAPDCGRPIFQLHGDLLVVLWELDGELMTPEGTTAFQSGHYDTTSARQYFITARDADLTFQGPASAPGSLFTARLDVTADPLVVQGARGVIAGRSADVAQAVLHGSGLSAHVERRGAALGLSAEHAARVDLDGTTIALNERPTVPPLAWLLLAIVVAVAAAWLGRQNSTTVLMRRLEELQDEDGRERDVIRLASRVLKRQPENRSVRTARGLAAGVLKRFDLSMTDLEAVVNADEHEWKAIAAVGLALNYSEKGRDSEALRALTLAYSIDPGFTRQAMNDRPTLRRLWFTPDAH